MSSRVNEVNGENLQDHPIKNPGYANVVTPPDVIVIGDCSFHAICHIGITIPLLLSDDG